MKKFNILKYCLLLILVCCSTLSFAQTYTTEPTISNGEMLQELTPQVLNTFGISNAPNPKTRTLSGNIFKLQQIGDFNRVAILSNSQSSEINLVQNGNRNFTSLRYDVKTAVADLQQNGDNNTIRDYVYNPTKNISLDLQQNGDNLYFERFGTNSITENLKLTQTGTTTPTIIIRSFQ